MHASNPISASKLPLSLMSAAVRFKDVHGRVPRVLMQARAGARVCGQKLIGDVAISKELLHGVHRRLPAVNVVLMHVFHIENRWSAIGCCRCTCTRFAEEIVCWPSLGFFPACVHLTLYPLSATYAQSGHLKLLTWISRREPSNRPRRKARGVE